MSDLLEQYILNHIDEESDYLKHLNRDVHVNLLRPRMLSGHLQGRFLKMICRMTNPKNILELGTYAGYSALCMAESLGEEAQIHTIEIEDELEDFIRKHLDLNPHGKKVKLHIGNAFEIVPTLNTEFDLVFIDADKRDYCEYFDLIFDKVRKGGLIVADNTLWDSKVLEEPVANDAQTIGILKFNEKIAKDNRIEKIILPLRDGITLIYKL